MRLLYMSALVLFPFLNVLYTAVANMIGCTICTNKLRVVSSQEFYFPSLNHKLFNKYLPAYYINPRLYDLILIVVEFKIIRRSKNVAQIITGYPIDGAMGSSDEGRVRKLSVVY